MVSVTSGFDYGVGFVDVYNFGWVWEVGEETDTRWHRDPEDMLRRAINLIDEYLGKVESGDVRDIGSKARGVLRLGFGWGLDGVVDSIGAFLDIVKSRFSALIGMIGSDDLRDRIAGLFERFSGFVDSDLGSESACMLVYLLGCFAVFLDMFECAKDGRPFVGDDNSGDVGGLGLFEEYVDTWLSYRSGGDVGVFDVVKCLSLFAPIFTYSEIMDVFGFKKAAFKDVELVDSEFCGEVYSEKGQIWRTFYVRRGSGSIVFFIKNYIVHFLANIYVEYRNEIFLVPVIIVGSRNWYSGMKEVYEIYGEPLGAYLADYKLGKALIVLPSYIPFISVDSEGNIYIDARSFCGGREYVREVFAGIGSEIRRRERSRQGSGVEWLAEKLRALYSYGLIATEGEVDWMDVAERLVDRINGDKIATSEQAALSAMIMIFDQTHKIVDEVVDSDTREARRTAYEALLGGLRDRVSSVVQSLLYEILGCAYGKNIAVEYKNGRKQIMFSLRDVLGKDMYNSVVGLVEQLSDVFGESDVDVLGIFSDVCCLFIDIVNNYIRSTLERVDEAIREKVVKSEEIAEEYFDKFKEYYSEVEAGDSVDLGVLNKILCSLENMGLASKYYLSALGIVERNTNDEDLRETIGKVREVCKAITTLRMFLYMYTKAHRLVNTIDYGDGKISKEYFDLQSTIAGVSAISRRIEKAQEAIQNADTSIVKNKNDLLSDIEKINEIRSDIMGIRINDMSIWSIINNVRNGISKNAWKFADYVSTMNMILEVEENNKRYITFRASTGNFLGKLFADPPSAFASTFSQSSSRTDLRWSFINLVSRCMSYPERMLFVSFLIKEIKIIGFSIYAKFLKFHMSISKGEEITKEDIATLVDSLTDYEVMFLFEILFGSDVSIDNRPPSEIRSILVDKLYEKISQKPGGWKRKISRFIRECFLESMGLGGKLKIREDEETIRDEGIEKLRERFEGALEESIEEIIGGERESTGILGVVKQFLVGEAQMRTMSPTLLANTARKFQLASRIRCGDNLATLSYSIILSILAESPADENELFMLLVLVDAVYNAGGRGYASIDVLLQALRSRMKNTEITKYEKMRIRRAIDRLLEVERLSKRIYGDDGGIEKLNELLREIAYHEDGSVGENGLMGLIEELLEKAIDWSEGRSTMEEIEKSVARIAQKMENMLKKIGGRESYSTVMPYGVENINNGEALIIRIAGQTIVATKSGTTVLSYAAYKIRNNEGKIVGVRFCGDIYNIATILAILFRNIGELVELINENKIMKNIDVASPTYPNIHMGAKITKDGKIKIEKARRFITWITIGLSTIKKQQRDDIIGYLEAIAEQIKNGEKGELKKILRRLNDEINSISRDSGVVWFVKQMLQGIISNVEKLLEEKNGKTRLETMSEEERKTTANDIKSIAKKIENIVSIQRQIAQKLTAPLSEETNPDRLIAILELIFDEIKLAPELREIIREELKKDEEKKKSRLGRWLEKIAEKWGTTIEKIAKAAAKIATIMGIAWLGTKLSSLTGTKSIAMSMALWLTFGPMAPIVARLFGRISKKIGKHTENLMSNIVNGMIVAIMTILGMLAMNIMLVATAPKEKIDVEGETIELPNPWRSPIRNIVTFMAPSVVWILASAAISVLATGIIGKFRNPSKIKEQLESAISEPEPKAKDIIMKVGLVAAMIMALSTYMKRWGLGIMDPMPSGVMLSAIAWVWDEMDDLGDGAERIEMWRIEKRMEKENGQKPKIDDDGIAEIIVLPFVLGAFAALCGITDHTQIIIPGSSGFLKYVENGWIGEPWGTIVEALIRIIFFSIGMLVACGTGGLGAVMYVVGSAMGQIVLMRILSAFSIVA